MILLCVLCLGSLFFIGHHVQAAVVTEGFVWLEAEQPTQSDFDFQVAASARPRLLSDGKYLLRILSRHQYKKQMPKQGWHLRYRFNAPVTDVYQLWTRLGFEWMRSPFQWRIDKQPWQEASAEVQTDNLMELATWNEIAWAKYGKVRMSAGTHTLELRFQKPGLDGRVLIGLDCLVLARRPFHPNLMLYAPVELIDRQAARQVYTFGLPSLERYRPTLSLTGLWQVARFDDPDMDKQTYEPLRQLPDPRVTPLRWMGIAVPSNAWKNKAELTFAHRLLYRTRVEIPASFAGRGFKLHFSGTNWIASVFVNGRFMGAHQSVLVPWDMDITDAIKPGQVNQIVIAIKSPWYAIDIHANKGRTRSLDHARNTPPVEGFARHRSYVAPIFPSTKGEGNGLATGLVNPVQLIVTGHTYTQNAFIKTDLQHKTIDAQLQLHNTTSRKQTLKLTGYVIDMQTRQTVLTLPGQKVQLEAGKTRSVSLKTHWENPKLWWPQDAPGKQAQLYRLQCRLTQNDKIIDVFSQSFGVRDLRIQGKNFLLNGVPWHFWNWVDTPPVQTPRQWLEAYHAQKSRFHRIAYDHDKVFPTRQDALNFFDQYGIPGRLSTSIDGMFITYNLNNPLVWKNFRRHVEQVVFAYRNHPSVMMYSLANELMFVTGFLRNGSNYREVETQAANLCKRARQLDPTRPSFLDGAGDLGGQIDMTCQHYPWRQGEQFPDSAYHYPTGVYDPARPHEREALFKWPGYNPLILGEVFYYAGNLSQTAWIGGPLVFTSHARADQAAGRFLRLSVEGARWQGVTAVCPWTMPLPGAQTAFEPRAVFVKEPFSTVYSGKPLPRTVKIFNDTREAGDLEFTWQLKMGDTLLSQGKRTYFLEAGTAREDQVTLPIPLLDHDARLTWRLMLHVGDRQVFQDMKTITVLVAPPVTPPVSLVVFDPSGCVIRWLKGRKVRFTQITAMRQMVDQRQTLLIGPDALNQRNLKEVAAAARRVVARGGDVLVLEQTLVLPLAGIALAPAKTNDWHAPRAEFEGAAWRSGRIAFIAAAAHPVLKNLTDAQFFTWGPDQWSFRDSFATPTNNAIALIQAGDDLALSPMIQLSAGRGQYLLSQMLIGHKLGIDPTADVLLAQMINWTRTHARRTRQLTFVLAAPDSALQKQLEKTGLLFQPLDRPEQLLQTQAGLAIMQASPGNVAWLRKNRQVIHAWLGEGRWLMLVGLTPKGLADFNLLVGFPHRLRKGGVEKVSLLQRRDPLLLGITDRDLRMHTDRYLARWKHLFAVSDRVFTYVVDGAEIASFAQLEKPHDRMMVNGLTNDDFWTYIRYLPMDRPRVRLQWDHPEKIVSLRIFPNHTYKKIKDIVLVFDNNPRTAVRAQLTRDRRYQSIVFPSHISRTLDIYLKSTWPDPSSKNLTGIDDLQVYRAIPKAMARQTVLLSKPGGLVKYPIQKGGILLNNLDYQREDTPGNHRKKQRLWVNLLRNMGASFRPDKNR